jgi:hypothetical protein
MPNQSPIGRMGAWRCRPIGRTGAWRCMALARRRRMWGMEVHGGRKGVLGHRGMFGNWLVI